MLGVIVAVALLSIPAIVSPGHPASTSNPEGNRFISDFIASPAGAQSTGTDSTNTLSDKLSLALGIFIILLPASVLSFLSRRWAARQLPDWYR